MLDHTVGQLMPGNVQADGERFKQSIAVAIRHDVTTPEGVAHGLPLLSYVDNGKNRAAFTVDGFAAMDVFIVFEHDVLFYLTLLNLENLKISFKAKHFSITFKTMLTTQL